MAKSNVALVGESVFARTGIIPGRGTHFAHK